MADSRVNVPARLVRGEPFEVRISIRHAMETGYRMDNAGKSIPRNVIRSFVCRYNGEPVFSVRMSSGIAANPVPALLRDRARLGRADLRMGGRRRGAGQRSRCRRRRVMRGTPGARRVLPALAAGRVRARVQSFALVSLVAVCTCSAHCPRAPRSACCRCRS